MDRKKERPTRNCNSLLASNCSMHALQFSCMYSLRSKSEKINTEKHWDSLSNKDRVLELLSSIELPVCLTKEELSEQIGISPFSTLNAIMKLRDARLIDYTYHKGCDRYLFSSVSEKKELYSDCPLFDGGLYDR